MGSSNAALTKRKPFSRQNICIILPNLGEAFNLKKDLKGFKKRTIIASGIEWFLS